MKKWGADIVRLWVSSQDFRNDITVSEERIGKVAEIYRMLRNALRYQLSNLYDFDPAKQAVPDEKLTGLDRWILCEFSKLEHEVARAYDAYEFHVVYQKITQFVAVELSAIYHDVVKDRLYTDAANSARRRSTQTALHRMLVNLCKMLAPILAFTADEAWEYVPGKTTASVHQLGWEPGNFQSAPQDLEDWKTLFKTRESVLAELEKARQNKLIGKALDAKVQLITHAANALDVEKRHAEEFRELLNVSQLEFTTESASGETTAWIPVVKKAAGQKCERCWHWETDVGSNPEHPTICARCVKAVAESTKA